MSASGGCSHQVQETASACTRPCPAPLVRDQVVDPRGSTQDVLDVHRTGGLIGRRPAPGRAALRVPRAWGSQSEGGGNVWCRGSTRVEHQRELGNMIHQYTRTRELTGALHTWQSVSFGAQSAHAR